MMNKHSEIMSFKLKFGYGNTQVLFSYLYTSLNMFATNTVQNRTQ